MAQEQTTEFACEVESSDATYAYEANKHVAIDVRTGGDIACVVLTPHNARAFATEIVRIANLVDGGTNEAS